MHALDRKHYDEAQSSYPAPSWALVLAGARGIQRFHAKHPRLQTHYPSASIQSQHLSTYKIGISDILDSDEKGHCSATAVGPHTLLTAGHCDLNTNKLTLGEEVVTILSVMPDGNDHVLYIVDHTLHWRGAAASGRRADGKGHRQAEHHGPLR